MVFRRRRRNRGRWFPTSVLGTRLELVAINQAGGWAQNVALAANQLIVNDSPAVAFSGSESLAATIGPGSSYLVKRIVGDVDASFSSTAGGVSDPANTDSHLYAFFGIFVDRVDANGVLQNLGAWVPFGQCTTGGIVTAAAQATLKRWMFRRVWHLGFPGSTAVGRDEVFPPYAASWYGSGTTGTHIDCKAKARVSYEERLFTMFAVMGGSPNVALDVEAPCHFFTNLRMFATPTTYNNR